MTYHDRTPRKSQKSDPVGEVGLILCSRSGANISLHSRPQAVLQIGLSATSCPLLPGGASEGRQQLQEAAGGAFECVHPGRQQIERHGDARQQIRREPLLVDQRADLPIGDLAPGDMGNLGREEIAASPACRFRDAAAELAALAVLADASEATAFLAALGRASCLRALAAWPSRAGRRIP